MEKSIMNELRDAEADSVEPYLDTPTITEAGRTHLFEMIENAREEIQRIEALLDNGAIPHPNSHSLTEDLDKYREFISDALGAITEPDTRFTEFVKIGETESYATFGNKDSGEWESINVEWSVWDLLGSPQVLKILKEK